MKIHVDITDIILVNFVPHFHFWQLKNSLCQKCHALGKIKGSLENKISIFMYHKLIYVGGLFDIHLYLVYL